MKKRILFVDDEKNIINGLRRICRSMRDKWDCFFVEGGEEALAFLGENTVDVVISDMRMPGMSGAELLNIIRERYPNIIRMILSGNSDQEMIIQSVKAAHQFLQKPCTLEAVSYTIDRTFLLRSLLNKEPLVKLVTGLKELPSLPTLYIKILKEIQSSDPSLKKVGDIIAQDVAMTAKVLRIVNSAFFSLPQKISNPQQATTFLGLDILKALIIQVELFSVSSSRSRQDQVFLKRLWRHSMLTGYLAREIARSVSEDKKIYDEALISGMLHDIGKLLLLETPHYIKRVKELIKKNNCSELEAENELFGSSHAEVGAYLLSLWGFSDSMIETVAFHHKPSALAEEGFRPLTAVHVANALVKKKAGSSSPVEAAIDYEYLQRLKLEDKLTEWSVRRNFLEEVDF